MMISVSDMAKQLKLSRDRFYDLIGAGIFPPPAYNTSNRRPVYPPELQILCLQVRDTGFGFNGRTVVFNRTKRSVERRPRRDPQIASGETDRQPIHGVLDRFCAKVAYLSDQKLERDQLAGLINDCGLPMPTSNNEMTVLPVVLRRLNAEKGIG